jgi:hypothetical protein
VCSLLILVQHPKHVHFAPQMLLANDWGPRQRAPLTKGLIIT